MMITGQTKSPISLNVVKDISQIIVCSTRTNNKMLVLSISTTIISCFIDSLPPRKTNLTTSSIYFRSSTKHQSW